MSAIPLFGKITKKEFVLKQFLLSAVLWCSIWGVIGYFLPILADSLVGPQELYALVGVMIALVTEYISERYTVAYFQYKLLAVLPWLFAIVLIESLLGN